MSDKPRRIVFISYSHRDKDFVNLFASLLLNFDVQIWKDSKDMRVGALVLESIYEGIKNSSHFCCVISSASVESPFVERELIFAKQRHDEDPSLSLVPILIDPVEIPGYLKAHLCAHLENRNLSLKNPELVGVLRAFGVELKGAGPRIITGAPRRVFLRSCRRLRDSFREFRELLGTFQERYEKYESARLVSRHVKVRNPPPPRHAGSKRSSPPGGMYRLVPNPAYSQHAIDKAEDRATSALKSLKKSASRLLAAIVMVRKAGRAAGLSMEGGLGGRLTTSDANLWAALNDALDLARGMSEAISEERLGRYEVDDGAVGDVEEEEGDEESEDDEDDDDDEECDEDEEEGGAELSGLWWVREKLPRWSASMPRIEAAVESAIGMLAYWGRFDTD